MRYEVVTDGKLWAVKRTRRVFWLFVVDNFRTLTGQGYWFRRNHEYFNHCWGSSDRAEQEFRRLIG